MAKTGIHTDRHSVKAAVTAQPTGVAVAAADRIASHLRTAMARRGTASLALSGGSSPVSMFAALAEAELDWSAVDVFQVDERWVDSTDPNRNWAAIQELLVGPTGARGHPLTVSGGTLQATSKALVVGSDASTLQRSLGPGAVLDVVHLGLGNDGHTASWPPGKATQMLLSATSLIEGVPAFNGFDRTTLTPTAVNRARHVVWYVVGCAKRDMLTRLLASDRAIPAAHVQGPNQEVFTDLEAFSSR